MSNPTCLFFAGLKQSGQAVALNTEIKISCYSYRKRNKQTYKHSMYMVFVPMCPVSHFHSLAQSRFEN